MNMKYAEILDDEAFSAEHFEPFTKQEGIDGIFYIDYWNYAGMKGDILWSNEKPVVSAKYRLWAELEDGQVDYIANAWQQRKMAVIFQIQKPLLYAKVLKTNSFFITQSIYALSVLAPCYSRLLWSHKADSLVHS